jgi:hypothetical protein
MKKVFSVNSEAAIDVVGRAIVVVVAVAIIHDMLVWVIHTLYGWVWIIVMLCAIMAVYFSRNRKMTIMPKFYKPVTSVIVETPAHLAEYRDAALIMHGAGAADVLLIAQWRETYICLSWQDGLLEYAHILPPPPNNFNIVKVPPRYWDKITIEVGSMQTIAKGEVAKPVVSNPKFIEVRGEVFFATHLKVKDGKTSETKNVQSVIARRLWSMARSRPHSEYFHNAMSEMLALASNCVSTKDLIANKSELEVLYHGTHDQVIGLDSVIFNFEGEVIELERGDSNSTNQDQNQGQIDEVGVDLKTIDAASVGEDGGDNDSDGDVAPSEMDVTSDVAELVE